MRYAMIMAGGAGTRLWPMSRRNRPKQLLPFIGGKSLLQIAADRIEGVVPIENRLICTSESFRAALRASMPEVGDEQILGEPVGRDTVNAVGFTAAVLAKSDPETVFAVLTADHIISPIDEFQRQIDLGFQLVERDSKRLVTFGIKPTRPETGYGYVEAGEPIAEFSGALTVKRFVEKPAAEAAAQLIAAGGLWNSGMFVFHARTFLGALARFQPESHAGLMKIQRAWATADQGSVLNEVYPLLPKISVDYAIMEPASRSRDFPVCIVPMNVQWLDVGSWTSYAETLPADSAGHRSNTAAVHLDSRNILAVSDDPKHTIATIGCENLIIVRTKDATLVCRADLAQRVKNLASLVDESLR